MISIGERLDGKYVIDRKLGSGGFGDVFLARDEAIPDRQVAIKVLSQGSAADHSDLVREMRALARFNHPGVVAFYHHFTKDERLCLVMEFCAGGSLDDLLVGSVARTEGDILAWGLTLCETLASVHERGIVHHDIKPQNIFFTEDGTLKVGDFGVANRIAGTRMYLPPEMLLGEPVSRTDARVDVYALGLTLIETLSGRHPFEDTAPEDAIPARMRHEFVPRSVSRWVQELLLKATHPTPELRFQTMRDFAEAIRGKHVPYVFDGNRIKAHALAQKAETLMARKKWKAAEKVIAHALRASPDCVAALLAAGRCQLLIRRIELAKEYFSKAIAISPRTSVQKELGWMSLEEGHVPSAISLLTDHLQRHSSDYEAYNLLLKCFFLSERFEAGEELGRVLMSENAPNECFRNNRFLCRLLAGKYAAGDLKDHGTAESANSFIGYNLAVATERVRAWDEDGPVALKSKALFEEFRFGTAKRAGPVNAVVVESPDGQRSEFVQSIVTIGSLSANAVVLDKPGVSRRHALVVNLPDEAWLYDLGSTLGVEVDGRPLTGRAFLDGVHQVGVAGTTLRIAARADLLL